MEPRSHRREAGKRLVTMTCWIEGRDRNSLIIGDDVRPVVLVCRWFAAAGVCVVSVRVKDGT